MPEKPKRKNKNKYKRKNKNNRADNSKNNCEVTEKESEGSCSAQIAIEDDTIPISEKVLNGLVPANSLVENSIPENEIDSEIQRCDISTNAVCVSEDVNNNSSAIAANTLQVPIEHLIDVDDNKNIDEQETDAYIVESPEQSLKSKPKLKNTNKSKSLDNDDAPKIVDITEDNVLQSEQENTTDFIDTSNILVSDAESDIEWEKTEDVEVPRIDDMAAESMSVSTAPLNVALCQQVNISLSPDIEASLRSYLHTLDLSTHPENSIEIKAEIEQIINREIKHRLRKKGFADDFGLQRLGPPRKLDVIDEEGSSESSKSSRRQSYLSDKRSDNEDLEDDVFEDKNKFQQKNAKWTETKSHNSTFGRLVPQQCMLVGAKIKEPEVTEARGDWTMQTVEKMTGAEIVYLTDSSSSTSSLHDYGDETDDGMETDVSVRMITPTIEVTDTENLLKNSFIASNQGNLQDEQVNQSKEHIIHKDYNQDNIEIAKKDKIQANSALNLNEILVLSTDNIITNLYVKDVQPAQLIIDGNEKLSSKIINLPNEENVVNNGDKYDLEIKVLKCELNDAINNLIKEVSDSEQHETSKDTFVRQDSSSSVSSSQCTAKYNPTSSSLNDISNILHDENAENNNLNAENNESKATSSHVKDVFEHVAGATNADRTKLDVTAIAPSHLRDLCVRRIASFPYGDKILEELASVSKRIQKITGAFVTENTDDNITGSSKIFFSKKNKMPYYDSPPIENIVLPSQSLDKESVPPPVQPRHSSLKKKSRDEEVWHGVHSKTEPVYVCLSPSQKMLMEKTQTIITKEDVDELTTMYPKNVDRSNYNEDYSREQHTDEKADNITPIVSFKSQTGSRLLALIRDPTLTNSVTIPNKHSSLDQLEQKRTMPQTTSKKHENIFDVPHTLNTFRPIPPPRPKKLASSFYESDESSNFTDSSMRSMKSDRKVFHFSTGNLNKEIEDDISSIQNMHRYYINTRETINESPRRPSLPKDLCDQQMEYIRQKEKEVEAEIQRLESLKKNMPSSPQKLGPRAPLLSETEESDRVFKDSNNYFISKRRDFFASLSAPEKQEKPHPNFNYKKEKGNLSKVFSSSQEELLREKMYSEYVMQMAQREERKQHKVIKITNTPAATSSKISKSMPTINRLDSKVNNRIEKEFILKAQERWDKLGIVDPETEDERDTANNVYKEPKVIEHKIKVIEGGQEKDVTNLPSHLQEFVRFTVKEKEQRNDSSGESKSEPASPHVMILCAVIIIVLAVGKYIFRLLRNK